MKVVIKFFSFFASHYSPPVVKATEALDKAFAILHGWKDGLSIDRIDVNSGYNKENIRFVDMRTQQNNRRNNKIIEYNGNKKTLSEWCIELNLNYPKIQARINKLNWEIKRAFETP